MNVRWDKRTFIDARRRLNAHYRVDKSAFVKRTFFGRTYILVRRALGCAFPSRLAPESTTIGENVRLRQTSSIAVFLY